MFVLDCSFLVEHFWGRKSVSVTLVAVCRVKGLSQQGCLKSKIPLRGSDVKDFNLKDTRAIFIFFSLNCFSPKLLLMRYFS